MQVTSRITLNAVTSWLSTIVNAALGLILVPFLLAQLGKEGYGLAALAGVIVSLTMMVDLGLRNAMGRQLAAERARKNVEGYNELASTAMFLYLGLGVLSASACLALAPLIARAFRVSPALMGEGVFIVRWYATGAILLTFATVVYTSSMASAHRYDLINSISTGMGIVRACFLFAVLSATDWGLRGWALCMILARAGSLLAFRWAAHRLEPSLAIRPSLFRRREVRPLFSLGGYLFAIRMTGLLSVRSDPIVLTSCLGPGSVALYDPASQMSSTLRPFVGTLAAQLHPLTTGYHVKGQKERLRQVLLTGTRYTLLMGLLASVLLGVFADPICRLWLFRKLGQEYRVTAHVLMVWAVVDLLAHAGGSQWPVLLGTGRLRFLAWTRLPLAFVNVLASVLFVKYTGLGVVGVIIPTAIIGMVRRPILVVHTARVVELSPWRYFTGAYVRPIVVLAVVAGEAVALRILIRPAGVMSLVACVVATGLFWAALVWTVGFTTEDRKTFRSLLGRIASAAGRLVRRSSATVADESAPTADGPPRAAPAETSDGDLEGEKGP